MKRLLALILCLLMTLPLLVACGEVEVVPSDSDTNVTDSSSTGSSSDVKAEVYPNKVIACDQVKNRVVIYDMADFADSTNLDACEEWSYKPTRSSCRNISGVKYRENTVFGDVILIVASGGYAGIIKYPEGTPVWEIDSCGNNPHSIEILPNGNVVCAASTGASVRLYYVSELLNGNTAGAQKYVDYKLEGAHGALWDPKEEVLWTVGNDELRAYELVGEGNTQTLKELGGVGATLPEDANGGHDLAADFSDSDYLWITGKQVIRFNKSACEFDTKYENNAKLNISHVKGFGNNLNGNFFFCYPNEGKGTSWETSSFASWCTDTIYYGYWKTASQFVVTPMVSKNCAYYKVRVFYGQYQ